MAIYLGRVGTAAGLLLAVGCAAPTAAPARPKSSGIPFESAKLAHHFPNFQLVTQDNETVRFYDDVVKGHSAVIHFMFTECKGNCTGITENLAQVQQVLGDRVGRDIVMVSISLDPEVDRPEVLRAYADRLGAKPGWLFLTGQKSDIEVLRRKLGVYDRDPVIDADKTQHAGLVVYGNEKTGRWGAMPALTKANQIAAAVLRFAGPEPAASTPDLTQQTTGR